MDIEEFVRGGGLERIVVMDNGVKKEVYNSCKVRVSHMILHDSVEIDIEGVYDPTGNRNIKYITPNAAYLLNSEVDIHYKQCKLNIVDPKDEDVIVL